MKTLITLLENFISKGTAYFYGNKKVSWFKL